MSNDPTLTNLGNPIGSALPNAEVAPPTTSNPKPAPNAKRASIDEVLKRVRQLTEGGGGAPSKTETSSQPSVIPGEGDDAPTDGEFLPRSPESIYEARLTESEVEELVLKYLLSRGDASGRDISDQIALPFRLVEALLAQMKRDQLIAHRGAAAMNDYIFQLSDIGRERARRSAADCSYFGTAPVALSDYIASVKAQSLNGQKANVEDLHRAFSDLIIDRRMLKNLGPAINSGKGMFLFGAAGNGKTSIAERVTACFGEHIWIPRALGIDGDVIRLFDPVNHVEAPLEDGHSLPHDFKIDKRWIRIQRPTIVVGGELTMDNLEVTLNTTTGISEAPMQLKSNCGTLVIDDFGRQRMTTDELLNRWIVPLEKRYDFLNLASGKKLQVPFDQLVIFSTNLEPRDLVDEAFLRRIPYKIEAIDPTEENFRKLIEIMAKIVKVEYNQDAVDYLIETHYKKKDRPMRNCQPRDLLLQIKNLCIYEDRPAIMSPEAMDFAVDNYFSVM
jgi:predicted ATPase with chaperone activity